jgi:hypothetical protein
VQAPGGQVAFNQPQGLFQQFAQFISPSAYASVSGLSPVPDGTLVQLARLNPAGTLFTVLATTPTAGGTYSFNLTNLGLHVSSDMVVQVINGAVDLRAFVTSSNVNLDPVSETAVRLVLQQVGMTPGATINNFTVQELADITGSINVLATAKQLAAGTNIENTVITIQNAVAANVGLTTFITAAAGVGQTTQGPGDVGNHVPLTMGNLWQFQGTDSVTGISVGNPPVSFQNTRTISGTKTIGNVMTQVSSESNPSNAGRAIDEYLVKDMIGLTNWGNNDATDTFTPQLVPYPELKFPLQPGSMFQAFSKQGMNFGLDVDGDGKNETVNMSAQVKVVGFETVVVGAGTFSNTIRVEATLSTVITLSRDGSTAESTETQTTWLASGVGPVKRSDLTQFSGISETVTEELVGSIVDGSGTGGAVNEVKTLALATNDIIYDKGTGKIYASIPGNPGSITAIDPVTGTTGASVVVGNQPNKLAISDDNQFLYVGLDGESAVRRVTLSTFTADLKFPLGPGTNPNPAACGTLSAQDIDVLTGLPHSVAVSIKNSFCSPASETVAIYDDGVRRPTSTLGPFIPIGGSDIGVIEFSQTASTLYGYDTDTTPSSFYTMAVTSSGVSVVSQTMPAIPVVVHDFIFDNGLIYTNAGYVINPATGATQGQFMGLPPNPIVRPDSTVGRVFFTNGLNLGTGGAITLWAYDINTLQLIAMTNIANVGPQELTSLIRWGTNGLAFRGSAGQVLIIRTSLVP